MATQTSSANAGFGNALMALLTSLQQGVTAMNNLTQTMASIFPSSS